MKRSKRYRAAASKVPAGPVDLQTAVAAVKGFAGSKFDETVEIHIRLGIDPKQADQIVRGSLVLPHGIGKTQRVAVFAKDALAEAAQQAGADVVGQAELAKRMLDGWLEFDVCIATPDMMGVVGPLGRVLGPRGLMPSPRAGTVTADVATAVAEYKAGKVEFRNDSGGNVHGVLGKLSFSKEQLVDNAAAFIKYVESLKPNSSKGVYVRNVVLTSTMGPGVLLSA
jgi:large subunit ribosomal protein L1